MSNIYIQEPPTEGKVLLETSVGDIEIELWSKEAPKACRNFIQLCMENYYNKTKFFRVVKEFIVQGGDPTNTGNGGESVWGKPFKDEFHSRLRFCRRGLVGMANAGKDDNGSQFFFTLGPTQELQNKHTCFGKVAGDTIYNMIKLGDCATDSEDRVRNPHKIIRAKVLINPFKDIVPRQTIDSIKDGKKDKRPKSNMKATKDFGLLSFGDEAEEEEEDLIKVEKTFKAKGKSSHDLLNDPTLLSEVGLKKDSEKEEEEDGDKVAGDEDVKEGEATADLDSIKDKLKKKKEEDKVGFKTFADYESEEKREKEKQREAVQKEIKALKKEMKKRNRKNNEGSDSDGSEKNEGRKLSEKEKNNDMLREFHDEQIKYASSTKKTVPKKGSARESLTMQLLEKFKTKLYSVRETDSTTAESNEGDEEVAGDDWMAKELKFENNDPVLAKDANKKDDAWFDIYDPRNPLNKRRREQDSAGKKKKRRD